MSDRCKSLLDGLRSLGYSPGFMALCETYGEVGEIVCELQKEIDRLRAELALAQRQRDHHIGLLDKFEQEAGTASRRDAKEIARLQRRANFFASVIKSGEAWSGTCEQEYRAALATSSGLTGGPPEKEDR
jgi:hypothetical protein